MEEDRDGDEVKLEIGMWKSSSHEREEEQQSRAREWTDLRAAIF
jgi:hypothetical protein